MEVLHERGVEPQRSGDLDYGLAGARFLKLQRSYLVPPLLR